MGSRATPRTAAGLTVAVEPVSGKADLDAFIRLPWRLYKDDRCWVPPLLKTQRELFSPKRNPFYQHADVQLFLAVRDGGAVGRISAQIDHEHNRFHGERTGFFGFYESENDPAIASALLGVAERWLRQRGMERVRGPLNFSVNGETGFLAEGFDSPPFIMMPHTHRYYLDLVQGCGYAKTKDVYAWRYDMQPPPERVMRVVEEVRKRPGIAVRQINMRRFHQDVYTILDLFNDAWRENWGFVPATSAEAKKLADDLRPLVDPIGVVFVEVNGVAAVAAVGVPNLNEAIRDLNGRLFPLGLFKLLWRLKVRRVKSGRGFLFGVRKEFRTREHAGLTYLLIAELFQRVKERGYEVIEASWTLEDNGLINSLISKFGAVPYKTYRIFEKPLPP